MIITYKFIDGSISQVEVSDELGLEIQRMDREEENDNRKYRRHVAYSLDRAKYQGEDFADPDTRERREELAESQARVDAFKATLTKIQLEVLELLEDGLSIREIARLQNKSPMSVQQSKELIIKKYKKFFK